MASQSRLLEFKTGGVWVRVRILVTGGAGFIGRHLVNALTEAGNSVVVLDRTEPSGQPPGVPDLNSEAKYIWRDLRDRAAVREAARGAEALVHLASLIEIAEGEREVGTYIDVNVRGTSILLDSLLKDVPSLQRILLTSSVAVYGNGSYTCPGDGPVEASSRRENQLAAEEWEMICSRCGRTMEPQKTSEDMPLRPISVYGWTKLAQEKLFAAASAAGGIPAAILRLGNVFGQGQRKGPYAGVVTSFLRRGQEGKPFPIHEDGRQTRDYVFVGDVVGAVRLALDRPLDGTWIGNIGSGRPTSVLDVAEAVGEALDLEPALTLDGTYRPGDVRHLFLETERARRDLGFTAATGLVEGMRSILGPDEEN